MSFSFFLLASPIRVRLPRPVTHQISPLLRALNVTAGPAGLVIISILAHRRTLLISAHFTGDTYTLLLWYLFTSQLIILPSRPPRFSSKLTCPAPHVRLVADAAQILVQTFGANGPPEIDELSGVHGKNNRLPTAAGATCGRGAIPPEVAGNVEPAGATIGGAGARGRGKADAT
jgi:hypothetical protein